MQCTRKINETIYWVGGSDRRLSRFENLFPLPNGVSYNSYAIIDEKTAVIDTVDHSISRQFLENVEYALNGRSLDYLIINHMEPDHCAGIGELFLRYPGVKIVGNQNTIKFLGQFYDLDLTGAIQVIAENDQISLGEHTLQFLMAPMVHWPETMVTYEVSSGILFSADAFGAFGALDGALFNDEVNFERDWLDESRRYYTNIVGKYGSQVQALLKKAAALNVNMICPLHGPVWRSDLDLIIHKYNVWSRNEPEEKGVLIAYASMYGNTENAANIIAARLADAGVANVYVRDVSSTDVSYLIGYAFKFSHIILASPTYNGGIYAKMEHFIMDMKALNLQNRTFALVENGTWAPAAGRLMSALVAAMKNTTLVEGLISIKSSIRPGNEESIQQLVDNISSQLGVESK